MKPAFTILILFLIGCTSPPQIRYNTSQCNASFAQAELSCQRVRRTINVSVDPKFTQLQKNWIEHALTYLSVLRIKIVINDVQPGLFVQKWINLNLNGRCKNGRLGEYRNGTNVISVDPECILSRQQFEAVVIHETGHWLGMHHICREDGMTSDTCSNVGRGLAIMNPYLDIDHNLNLTQLDIEEYERNYINRCFIP